MATRTAKENPRIREDGGFHGVFATALRPIPGVRCSRCNPHEGEPYGGGLTIKDADGFHAGLNVLDVYGVLAGVEPAPSSAFVMAPGLSPRWLYGVPKRLRALVHPNGRALSLCLSTLLVTIKCADCSGSDPDSFAGMNGRPRCHA